MSYSEDSGYTPVSVQTIMLAVMAGVNAQWGTSYTEETFEGSGFYKMYYALVQRMQENEIKTAEIFLKVQDYFALTNERISRPVNTNPGLLDRLESEGFISSIRKPVLLTKGEIAVCVDLKGDEEDYADKKLRIGEILRDSTVAGTVTIGDEVVPLTLTNGQLFDFKFDLPDRIEVKLRLTLNLSENNQFVIGSPDSVRLRLINNISERYRLGKNFEPQRYYSILDAPWAESVLLQWSGDDGVTWNSTVFEAEFDELFDILLENVEIVENS